jgi:RNA polymerase sigma-70 factor, ECF subfamily
LTETAHQAHSLDESADELLRAYQRGDSPATARLVRVVSPVLLRYFMSQGDSSSDAQDTLQEAWLRIHKARATYRPEAPAMPWLFAIARHTRLDLYRKRARIARRELQFEELPEPAQTERNAFLSRTAELLASLPEREREILTMTKGLGMSLEEAARATASTVGAVKQLSHRAYVRLRSMLLQTHESGPLP